MSHAARIHLAREIRDRLHEENYLALHLAATDTPQSIAGQCQCGAPLDDPTSDRCGPCGRDSGAR